MDGSATSIASDHMVKILQKENEQLKAQLLKKKGFLGNSTLSSILEVLQLQRQKIDSLEAKNKKMVLHKSVLLEQLKGLELRNKAQTFYSNVDETHLNQADHSIMSNKSQTIKPSKKSVSKVNPNESQPLLQPSTKLKRKRKVKLATTSEVVPQNKVVDNEVSKLPYDYDSLLNGLRNKSLQQGSDMN